MTLVAHTKSIWLKAQEAEKGHWAYLWLSATSELRTALVNGETIKAEFIFQQMIDHFVVNPKKDWESLKVLDVGCGPLSLVARHSLGKSRAGVDPLQYPPWVYQEYSQKNFEVYMMSFEEFSEEHKFDVVIFYNALQHFANLEAVAEKCETILAQGGTIYLSEYLEVPTNDAHIQFLEAPTLNNLFKRFGFTVRSATLPIRLPGYVERPGGFPIDLYVARLTRS